jgi:hypothetical protein
MGTIPARKIGNTWLIARADLAAIAAIVRPKQRKATA